MVINKISLKKKLYYNNNKYYLKKKFLIKKRGYFFLGKLNLYNNIYKPYIEKKNILFETFFFFLGKRFFYEKFKNIKMVKSLIYGISLKRGYKFFICKEGVNVNYLFINLNILYLKKLQDFILSSKVNLYIKKQIIQNLALKRKLKTYQYFRQKYGLPSRGQRSYANAGTAKRLNK